MRVILNKPDFNRENKDNNPVVKTEIEVKELTPFIYINEGFKDKKSGIRIASKYARFNNNVYIFVDYV